MAWYRRFLIISATSIIFLNLRFSPDWLITRWVHRVMLGAIDVLSTGEDIAGLELPDMMIHYVDDVEGIVYMRDLGPDYDDVWEV